ncbi:MAG: SRPBCC domain-containing protein, partial [Nitrososphaeraceae archaeon]
SLKTNKGKIRVYRPTITKFEENHELRWKGRSILPGLLTGERVFRLDETSEHRVRLVHSELFSGIAIVLAGDRLSTEVQNSLLEMNIAFKNRVEQET